MFQPMPVDVSQFTQLPQMKPKGGMFGGGDWKQALAAALSAMSAARGNPVGMAGLQMLNQRLGQKREDQQYERRQADQWDMWQRQQQWKQQHDTPELGEFERAVVASGIQPGTPQWAEVMGKRRDAMLDPVVNLPTGPTLRSMVVGGLNAANAKPLTDDDILKMSGGPTPQASGGFSFPF
jgi:hypothetical protein